MFLVLSRNNAVSAGGREPAQGFPDLRVVWFGVCVLQESADQRKDLEAMVTGRVLYVVNQNVITHIKCRFGIID